MKMGADGHIRETRTHNGSSLARRKRFDNSQVTDSVSQGSLSGGRKAWGRKPPLGHFDL